MARGNSRHKKHNHHDNNFDKKSSFRGNRNSVHKPKNRKNKRKFEQSEKPNQDVKRQKIEEIEPNISSSESEAEVEYPLDKLIHTFDLGSDDKKSVAVESEDSENSENESDVEIDVALEQKEEEANQLECELDDGDITTDIEEAELDDTESLEDKDLINSKDKELKDIEIEVKDEEQEEDDLFLTDPFVHHVCYDLNDECLDNLQNNNQKDIQKIDWPTLGTMTFLIPKWELTCVENKNFTIAEDKKYAAMGKLPTKIGFKDVNLTEISIKTQIINHIKPANKCIKADEVEIFTPLQSELFSIMNNYQDLLYTERTFENGEEIRFAYCLHTINHVLKTRTKILHHNARLKKKTDCIVPEEFRDQGLIRPKVLIIVPFRDSALKIVRMLIDILVPDEKGQVINKLRFMEDFSGGELILSKKNPRPEDYEKTFSGNYDDTFKIGIQVTKKSLKLYADFYSSDIIISSPLGLRLTVGAEGESKRDYDFLASIELLILDQTELFLMQNWDHLIHVLDHFHIQPSDSHGTDFSRVRTWALNGLSKYYRQTLIFSSIALAKINSIFNKKCFNYAGAVRISNPINSGSILSVHVQLPQVFRKFFASTHSECINDRFNFFITKVLPQFKDSIMKQTLIYVPDYFDYVRLRNYFKREDVSFVQVCEYSKEAKVARARDIFFHGNAQFMLYSERMHYFRRYRIKGIRHIIFYQPPTLPHFYSEMCNFMQEANQNKKCGSLSNMSVTTIYSKYDAYQIAGVVGTERITKMAASLKNFHMFTSSDS